MIAYSFYEFKRRHRYLNSLLVAFGIMSLTLLAITVVSPSCQQRYVWPYILLVFDLVLCFIPEVIINLKNNAEDASCSLPQ